MSLPITDYDVNSTNRAVSVVEAARFCYAGDVKTYRKMTVQKNEKGEEQMKKLLENKSYGFYVTFEIGRAHV